MLGEAFEMDYPEKDFVELANLAIIRKIKCKELLDLIKWQIILRKKDIPFEETKEIIISAILKNIKPSEIKIILKSFYDAKIKGIDSKKIKGIIMEGIERKNLREIKKLLSYVK